MLLPVGSTEWHGPRLPTGIDDFLSAEACCGAVGIMVAQGRPVAAVLSAPIAMVTSSGVAGDARGASAEKGEAILDACAEAIAGWLMK